MTFLSYTCAFDSMIWIIGFLIFMSLCELHSYVDISINGKNYGVWKNLISFGWNSWKCLFDFCIIFELFCFVKSLYKRSKLFVVLFCFFLLNNSLWSIHFDFVCQSHSKHRNVWYFLVVLITMSLFIISLYWVLLLILLLCFFGWLLVLVMLLCGWLDGCPIIGFVIILG